MTDKRYAFVIMPFDAELNEIYEDFLAPTLRDVGFEVARADDLFDQQNILRSIVGSIQQSHLVVADLTGLNPNVFYELGVAHALNRPVILLTQNIEELPFDLRSYRVIQYDTHFRRIGEARQNFRKTAEGALNGTIEFGNPVSDFSSELSQLAIREDEGAVRTEEDHEEAGWLDHLVALEEGYEQLNTQLGLITAATQSIGEDTEKYSDRLQTVRNTAGRERSSATRALAMEYGRRLGQFGEELSAANTAYEAAARDTQNSVEFIISHAVVTSDEDQRSLEEYLRTLEGMVASAMTTRGQIGTMRETLRGIEGLERSMTRAARLAGGELDRFIGNIEHTVAAAQRGLEVGHKKLAEFENSGEED